MAEFLRTADVTSNLDRFIRDAKERLWLVSPYLKINQRLRTILEDKDRFKIDIRVIYGKNELQPEEKIWLRSLSSIRVSYCQNLHAKCFLTESEALVTSMNLYEFSQVNNHEMGVLIKKDDDPQLYNDVYEEVSLLLRSSGEVREEVEIVPPNQVLDVSARTKKRSGVPSTSARSKSAVPVSGFCIRCKADLKADPTHPYCTDCYRVWKQYENPEYEEKFCHTCGNLNASTLDKPTCYSCYRKYRNVLTFPLAKS